MRASLYKALKNKQAARRDVDHILVTCKNDPKIYIEARKLKDEIESIEEGCFIATAVYEPEESVKVDILRDYRDRILLQSTSGRIFVSIYYSISPPIAQVIARHELLKTLTRMLLEPIIKLVSTQ